MKNTICICLALLLTSCAVMKRHPVITAAVVGVAAGVSVAVIQNRNNSCPGMYDGKPYQGTPPCPK